MTTQGFIGYVALFTKAENEKYFVEFPDLIGCYTQGSTLEEAVCHAQEVLAIYCVEKKENYPQHQLYNRFRMRTLGILPSFIAATFAALNE